MREYAVFLHSTGTGPFLFDKAAPKDMFGEVVRLSPTNLGYPPLPVLPRGEHVTVDHDAANALKAIPADAERIHLFAHSYGGLVAQKLLPKLEGRLASLWLNEPVLFGALRAEPSAHDAESLAEADEFTKDTRFLEDEQFGGTDGWLHRFIDYWNGPGTWEAMAAPGRAYAQKLGWKMYQEVRAVFGQHDPADAYRTKVPLTLAIGEKTTALSRGMTRAMATLNPHATVEHLKGLGHMALLTKGAEVAPSIRRHFETHVRRK